MKQLIIFILKTFRKIYSILFDGHKLPPLQYEENPEIVSEIIYNLLSQNKPCMIARFGAFELGTIVNYLGIKAGKQSLLKYIKGEALEWWWNEKWISFMNSNAGFFPPTKEHITRFCKLMIEDTKEVDILGSWQKDEYYLRNELEQAQKIQLIHLDPYWSSQPWTRALKGKRVLVIHPFAETIQLQYQKRELLFKNSEILPAFKSLQVIKAVQSLGGEDNGFNNWFEALEFMKHKITKCDYDICLIGCGAYGFPLAAHVKRMGKKAIHMGGSLQLLFGITGSRWENPNFGIEERKSCKIINYPNLKNEYWARPEQNERPKNATEVENACYW